MTPKFIWLEYEAADVGAIIMPSSWYAAEYKDFLNPVQRIYVKPLKVIKNT